MCVIVCSYCCSYSRCQENWNDLANSAWTGISVFCWNWLSNARSSSTDIKRKKPSSCILTPPGHHLAHEKKIQWRSPKFLACWWATKWEVCNTDNYILIQCGAVVLAILNWNRASFEWSANSFSQDSGMMPNHTTLLLGCSSCFFAWFNPQQAASCPNTQ